MKKMITAVLLFALPVYVNAADIAAGKTKSATCAVCHGANGISASPIYPNLSGQKEAYLVSSLKAYKAAQRQGGMAAIMNAQAKGLSDADIADLAAYYASLK